MSNKTSDKNVANIEELIKEYKTYNDLDGIQDLSIYINALENILAEREQMLKERDVANDSVIAHKFAVMQQQLEQKDKRIKELEEENKRKDMFVEMAKEVIENSILKQVVKDKIEEYKKQQNKYENELQEPFAFNYFHREALKLAHKIQALQELLEGEK